MTVTTNKTLSDIKAEGYTLHHTSYTRGYVSRKNWSEDKAIAHVYNGKFGTGFTVLSPDYKSSRYCHISYYTK